ncbi:T9SS type A sorting domain-containing protein [Neolewinella antarctica]|uniref:Secretion system C-terminal sorting domain-containing protein n=1 Tax=Neolewinella antarctica TaxID=442734 RepID=A0ABX0XG69_9BACT|nr:T9SS type A sorting domain-containing protein [Neolewinella antarctica]NJC27876.1 hypothetical protein [Neolewinella antarctica]
MKVTKTLLLSLLLCTGVRAQNIELEPIAPRVTVDGRELTMPWFGGLNAPQFQAADLDNDGTDDLLIYDRTGQQFLAARSLGGGQYRAAPELLVNFPKVDEWMAVRDYNQDGTPDLFTYADGVDGIQVLRGKREADGLLSFEVVDFGGALPILYFPFGNGRTNIFVTAIDYPSIADVDFDGDLDILTFSVIGGYVEFYKNVAVERGFGADTLIYVLDDQCYGGFFESGLSTALDLAAAPGECYDQAGLRPIQTRHSGSTILSLDYSGNGLMDMLLGDISFSQLTLGLNNGSRDQAWISEQDPNWQAGGVTAQIPSFPAAFHLDVDQDGDRDLVGAPTTTLNGGDVEVGWLYDNVGTDAAPDFQFSTRRFLVDEMIDLGTSANATTFDYDADGRLDLVLGNNDEYTGANTLDSRLRLFRNVTPQGGELAFELVDEDYLGLSSYTNALWAYAPTFGDLDADGDEDVIIGTRDGKLIYIENRGGAGQLANFGAPVFEYFGLDAGQFSKPFLSDLDRDGALDLLVGGFDGRIRFYRNAGTATEPLFDPSTSAAGNALQLGGINAAVPGSSTGHPTPWVIQRTDHTLVVTGNQNGTLEAYRFGLDTTVNEPFKLLTEVIDGATFGSYANPAFGDFDGDGGLELVVGNERGGAAFFRTNLLNDTTVPLRNVRRADFDFTVSPNPTTGRTIVSGWPAGSVTEVTIFDVSGRQVAQIPVDVARSRVQWNGKKQAKGIYLARLTGPGGTATRKIVVR